jgi:type I restriction enzyme R subunit
MSLFASQGWSSLDCYDESLGSTGNLGRETTWEVVLRPRLLTVLKRLNPDLPSEALTLAIEEIATDRGLMVPEQANREVHQLLKNGIKVSFESARGEQVTETVKVIDWNSP